jgi:hypothetical protein
MRQKVQVIEFGAASEKAFEPVAAVRLHVLIRPKVKLSSLRGEAQPSESHGFKLRKFIKWTLIAL